MRKLIPLAVCIFGIIMCNKKDKQNKVTYVKICQSLGDSVNCQTYYFEESEETQFGKCYANSQAKYHKFIDSDTVTLLIK